MKKTREVRLDFRPSNNLVRTAMEEQGVASIADLCRSHPDLIGREGVVGKIIGLRSSPFDKRSDSLRLKKTALAIAKGLRKKPSDLFPEAAFGKMNSGNLKLRIMVDVKRLQWFGIGLVKELVASRS